MQARSTHARLWAALGHTAVVALCVLVLQQCSKPTGSPTGPSTPPIQPPTTPTPNPTPPGPQTFVGAGDIAICDGRGNQEATARLLDVIGGTVFTLGDNAYPNGTPQNFRECYEPSWGRHQDRTRPVPGNHEYHTPGAQGYYDYFGANAGAAGLGYYSYNLGAWHIIALNSEEPIGSSAGQRAWLQQDLAVSSTKCTLAYWHHPVFSSGPNGNSGWMQPIYKLLYEANVDVVLNGHDHLYERFAPQDADGRPDSGRGIVEFIVGTGGVPHYNIVSVKPNSLVRLTGDGYHGVLKMTLNADTYGWEFVTIGRGVQDPGFAACH